MFTRQALSGACKRSLAYVFVPLALKLRRRYSASRGDYVIRHNGTTCLQLLQADGSVKRLEGDPLQVAIWIEACQAAGMAVRVQVNESAGKE